MVNLKNRLIEIDRNPVLLSINFNRTSQYKSYVGGILALVFFIIAFGIISFRTLDLFQRNHREVELNVFKENDLEYLDISSINISFSLVTSDDKGFKPIYFEEYLSYGFEAKLMKYSVPVGQTHGKPEYIPFISCNGNKSACLPENIRLSVMGFLDIITPESNTPRREIEYQRYSVILIKCDPNTTSGCEKFKKDRIDFYGFFSTPWVSSDGDIISKNDSRRGFQSHKFISGRKTVSMTFFLKRVNVLTYETIWPEFIHLEEKPTKSDTNWFYDEERIEEEYGEEPDILLEIYLKRSAYTHEFTIKYDRFNKMVSEVNGMLAFVALILTLLYKGYNEWSFEQEVRKKLGILYVKPTLWNFYKSKFRLRGETDEEIEQRLILAAKLDYFKVAEQMPIIIEEEGFEINTSFAEGEESSNFNPLLINRPTTLSPSRNRLSLN